MNRVSLSFILGLTWLVGTASAALEIVATNAEGKDFVYVLKDTSTGKVYGMFWSSTTGSSDYGFESSNPPDLLWSADRSYLAVNPRDNNARWTNTSLFLVTSDSLEPVELPAFPPGSADALEAVRASSQLAADQTKAVRWQTNGSLLVSYFVASRETDDTPQVEASLWADLTFVGNRASIAATGPTEPAADSSVEATIAASLTSATNPEKPALESESDGNGLPDDLVGIDPFSGKNPDSRSSVVGPRRAPARSTRKPSSSRNPKRPCPRFRT